MPNLLKSLLRPFLKPDDFSRIFGKSLSRERIGLIATAGLARIFGKRAKCHQCGGKLPKVLAFMRGGQLAVWGLQQERVIAEFADRQTLRFRHAVYEACAQKYAEDKSK